MLKQEEKIIKPEVSGYINVINVFHDVNSVLCTVNNIYSNAEIFVGKTQSDSR